MAEATTTPAACLGSRELFPGLTPRVYANHAAISPPSTPVLARIRAAAEDYAATGVGAFGRWMGERAQLRDDLASLLGADAEDIGFIPNTTAGVVAVAQGLAWESGDRVVVFEGEFPTNVTPWLHAAHIHDLVPVMLSVDDYVADPGVGLERLETTLRAGARLVAVSAVQFQTGLTMPVREMAALCRSYGAEIFVDAIQACGVVPFDVKALDVDYVAAGGHKWLMGTEGSGFLWARHEAAARLRPAVAGWLSHEDGIGFLFEGAGHMRYDLPVRDRASFVEAGVPAVLPLAALGASVALISQLGVTSIRDHVWAWHDRLEAALQARGFHSLRGRHAAQRSGILALHPPEGCDVVALHAGLSERGVSASIPDGNLRFAPHWPNSLDEIDVVLEVMLEVIDTLL